MKAATESFQLARLQLTDIRGFGKLQLNFRSNGDARRRTLIIGKNGTCKSSILRAIALCLADQTDASKLISEPIGDMISRDRSIGSIEVELAVTLRPPRDSQVLVGLAVLHRSGDKEELQVKRDNWRTSEHGIDDSPPEPFVCGYGAGRFGGLGTGPEAARAYRIADSVSTLFNYQQPLVNTELALRRLSDFLGTSLYQRTLQGIKRTLGLTDADAVTILRGGGVEISGPSVGKAIRFEAWADGYRMTFSWIVDLYAWAMRADSIDKEGHIRGILLIDEIKQHLHTSMQAEILPRLSELFPKMQIFATTHSPLVALDAKPEELVVLRREGGQVVAEKNVPNYLGYSVEDMLTDSRLFDAEIYGTVTREKLTEYRELVSIPKEERSFEQRHKLQSLAAEIGSFEAPTTTQENETARLLKELIAKYDL